MSNHSLVWATADGVGNLDLTSAIADGHYWFETLAESATFGDPQPVEEGLTSLLIDGTRKRTTRHDNRTPTFRVMVKAATADGLAQGEAALWRMAQELGTFLIWTPPDVFGAPTCFDVEVTRMEFLFDDLQENRLESTYQLSWECQPYARASVETVHPAVAPDSSLTVVDDCSSAAGWRASEGTPVASSGAVVFTESVGDNITGMTRDGAIDMSERPYLVVDWKTSVPGVLEVYGFKNSEVMRTVSPFGSTWVRSYFYHPDGFVTGVGFLAFPLPLGATVSITQLATAKTLPDSETAGHQQTLAIVPGGSARTQAGIEVVHDGTVGLGEVVLYTGPLGRAYNPSLRRWLYDADEPSYPSPSGDVVSIAGPAGYDIPASTIPFGGYVVAARMMCNVDAAVSITYSIRTIVGGMEVGDYTESAPVIDFTASQWRTVPLGLATLPTSRVGPGGTIRLGIQRGSMPGGVGEVYVQDVFLFHEDGDLTIVDCGTGTASAGGPARRARITPPTHDRPGGGLDIGHSADWSDAFAAGAGATVRPPRGHVLHPGGTSVFVMADGTPDNVPADVSFRWFERSHTRTVNKAT